MKSSVFPKMAPYVFLMPFCLSTMAAENGNLKIICRPGIRTYLDDEFVGVTKPEEQGSRRCAGLKITPLLQRLFVFTSHI